MSLGSPSEALRLGAAEGNPGYSFVPGGWVMEKTIFGIPIPKYRRGGVVFVGKGEDTPQKRAEFKAWLRRVSIMSERAINRLNFIPSGKS